MKRYLSVFIICITFFQGKSIAQDFRIETPPGYNFIYNSNNLPKGIDGTPYLTDWQKAELQLIDGSVIYDLPMRYNVYTGQMIFKKNDEIYGIGAPDSISMIKFNGSIFKYKGFVINDVFERTYYEIVIDDKASLYKKYDMVITPSNYNEALDVGNKNDRFTLKETLYLQKGDKLVELDKKKKVMQFFSDKEKEISDYIKQEKLSYKDENDVIKLVEYYNQLI